MSICLSVRLSVRLSVKRVNCDKTYESSTDILIPYERSIHLVFRHKEWFVEDIPFYLTFWAKLTPTALKTAISNRYLLVAPHPLVLAKKSSIITNRKLITSFPMILR